MMMYDAKVSGRGRHRVTKPPRSAGGPPRADHSARCRRFDVRRRRTATDSDHAEPVALHGPAQGAHPVRALRRCRVGDARTAAVRPRVGPHAAAVGLLAVIFVAESTTFGRSRWQAVPPFTFFVVVMILRDGSGGTTSGLGALVMLPILWVAMYGTRVQMWLAVAATSAVYVLPIYLIGGRTTRRPTGGRRSSGDSSRPRWVRPSRAVVRRLHEREQRAGRARRQPAAGARRGRPPTSRRWRALLDHLPDTSVFSIDRDLRHTVAFGAGLDQVGMSHAAGRTSLRDLVRRRTSSELEPVYRAGLGGRRGVGRVHREQRRPDDRADLGSAGRRTASATRR